MSGILPNWKLYFQLPFLMCVVLGPVYVWVCLCLSTLLLCKSVLSYWCGNWAQLDVEIDGTVCYHSIVQSDCHYQQRSVRGPDFAPDKHCQAHSMSLRFHLVVYSEYLQFQKIIFSTGNVLCLFKIWKEKIKQGLWLVQILENSQRGTTSI